MVVNTSSGMINGSSIFYSFRLQVSYCSVCGSDFFQDWLLAVQQCEYWIESDEDSADCACGWQAGHVTMSVQLLFIDDGRRPISAVSDTRQSVTRIQRNTPRDVEASALHFTATTDRASTLGLHVPLFQLAALLWRGAAAAHT